MRVGVCVLVLVCDEVLVFVGVCVCVGDCVIDLVTVGCLMFLYL